jgi:hypothetical protein
MISKLVLCFASVVLSFLAASSQTQPGAERKILVRKTVQYPETAHKPVYRHDDLMGGVFPRVGALRRLRGCPTRQTLDDLWGADRAEAATK